MASADLKPCSERTPAGANPNSEAAPLSPEHDQPPGEPLIVELQGDRELSLVSQIDGHNRAGGVVRDRRHLDPPAGLMAMEQKTPKVFPAFQGRGTDGVTEAIDRDRELDVTREPVDDAVYVPFVERINEDPHSLCRSHYSPVAPGAAVARQVSAVVLNF
jgi:hypothetical protein